MLGRKIISLTLVMLLIFSLIPNIASADIDERLIKKVYLHADGVNPSETKLSSQVNKGEIFNLYFAIDDPNEGGYIDDALENHPDIQAKIAKAAEDAETDTYEEANEKADDAGLTGDKREEYINNYVEKNLANNIATAKIRSEQIARHTDPQYDLNGFSVKIYFDSKFFEYVPEDNKQYQGVIDYTVPNGMIIGSTEDEDIGVSVPGVFNSVGYQVREYTDEIKTDASTGMSYALVHVYYSGSFLEQEKNPENWYNLCAIQLKAKKTGSSKVYIGTGSDYGVKLYAKHSDAADFQPLFEQSAENGGYHTIHIVDQTNPLPPVATPSGGRISEKQEITLISPTEGCDIYYSINGGEYKKYEEPFTLSQSSEIVAYTQKQKDDGAKSSLAVFNYRVIPDKPLLYKEEDGKKVLITDPYYEYDPFTVYADNKSPYDDTTFDPATYVYYTYSDIYPEDFVAGGTDPDTEWVRLNKPMGQSIDIEKNATVRLIAVKETASSTEVSEVAVYHLGIMPSPVKANPKPGSYDGSLEVNLTADDDAEIYFTLDGTDPRVNGTCYIPGTLILDDSKTIRAVAKKDGVYSEVKDFYYEITNPDDDVIYADTPSGKYTGTIYVTLVSEDGSEIEYSDDGGNTWKNYTGPVEVSDDTEIFARKKDDNNADIYNFNYEIVPCPPVFSPEETIFAQTGKVTVYSPETTTANTGDYTLYYTTDGSDPRTNGEKAPESTDMVTISVNDKTEIKAVVKKGDSWSEVVSAVYDVYPSRPATPDVTLKPGVYETTPENDEFTTGFTAVDDNNTKIYYTVTYGDVPTPDPVVGDDNTHPYDPQKDEIELKGRTVINVIAVNVADNTVSEVGVYEYIIVPFTPVAKQEGGKLGEDGNLIEVIVPEGSDFTYKTGDNEEITVKDVPPVVYVDLESGIAYKKDKDGDLIALVDMPEQNNSGDVTFEISCELDGQKSGTNTYSYKLDSGALSMPWADLESGVYTEEKRVGNLYHEISLDSSNEAGAVIEYKLNDGKWQEYDDNEKIPLENIDTVLYARVRLGDDYSDVVKYVYEFVPPAPVIEPVSGIYPAGTGVKISLPDNLPKLPDGKTYSLYIRSDETGDVLISSGVTFTLKSSVNYKAYVVNNYSKKHSENTFRYYIVNDDTSTGSIYTIDPYEVNSGDTLRVSKADLSEEPYNEGIRLRTKVANAFIKYSYVVTKGETQTNPSTYTVYDDTNPIVVSSAMDKIEITAKLVDYNGDEIEGSECVFTYEFVDLEVPVTDLYLDDPDRIEYPKNTAFTFVNEYEDDESVCLFYTTDNKNKSPDKDNATLYTWDTPVKITKDMTVRAVYYMACLGDECDECKAGEYHKCENGIYSKTAKYQYTVKTSGGAVSGGSSSGGGRVIDNTRKYTKDIFGYEHPTHISYINGYPDGSVQPNGNITREEMAAIIYRISNHEYEAPFVVSGEVFPDVESDRWSVLDIEYLAEKGIINGYPDGEFKPSGNLSRAEFAALIARFTSQKSKRGVNPFGDLSDSHWAYKDILALYERGLISGYEDQTFRPDSKITRAEVMTVVNKLLGRNPSESYVKSLEINPYNDLTDDKWYYVDVIEATITHNYYLDSKDVEYKWEDIK